MLREGDGKIALNTDIILIHVQTFPASCACMKMCVCAMQECTYASAGGHPRVCPRVSLCMCPSLSTWLCMHLRYGGLRFPCFL